jgi:hypothetical protein
LKSRALLWNQCQSSPSGCSRCSSSKSNKNRNNKICVCSYNTATISYEAVSAVPKRAATATLPSAIATSAVEAAEEAAAAEATAVTAVAPRMRAAPEKPTPALVGRT